MKLTEILQEYGVKFATPATSKHVTEGWIGLVCPFCDGGRGNFGLGVNLRSNATKCWKCGPHSLAEVFARAAGVHVLQARRVLGLVEKGRAPGGRVGALNVVLPKPAPGPLLPAHIQYLRKRRFNPTNLVNLWKIQGFGIHPKYPWRIFIPIILEGGVVSWTTRSISDEDHGRRYRTAKPDQEKIHHKDILFGMDHVWHTIVVCEGPFDVFRVGPGAVCTFGTGWTEKQLVRISRFPVRVVCYDSDREAQKRARRLCDALEPFDGQTHNVVLSAGDPGEAVDEIGELKRRFLG